MNMPLLPPCPALAVVAACLALPAHATLPDTALASALALARDAAQALAPAGARVEVQPGALDPRLRLAPCAQVQAFLPAGVAPWGRARVGLRCVQGPVAWQVHLPVQVQVWAPGVVAASPLPAGAALDASQLQLAATDWAATTVRPHGRVEELEGRVLARPLNPGQAVRSTDLRPRQWFAQGETVQIVAQGRGFAITAEGQALAPGLEGQPVRVRTESGRVVVAVPVAQRRVEMTL